MASATWPVTLPTAPLMSGFVESVPNNSVRTEMETGQAKVRRRYTQGVRMMEFPLLLTTTQTATLDTFFDSTLQSGSLTFDGLNHPRTGSAITEMRIVEAPQYVPVSDSLYRTNIKIEILPS